MLKKYTLGFEPWGLALFLLIMIPAVIWAAVPAPNDVLRMPSVTPRIGAIGSAFQALMVAAACFVRNRGCAAFRAVFTGMELTRCKWPAHDGQPPDRDQ